MNRLPFWLLSPRPLLQWYANDELQVGDLNITGLSLHLYINLAEKPMRMRHEVCECVCVCVCVYQHVNKC